VLDCDQEVTKYILLDWTGNVLEKSLNFTVT